MIVQLQRIKSNHQKILNSNREKLSYVFGSNWHKFKLNPITSENVVKAFERKYEFEYPDEYRSFILAVGNGGAGPFYGINGIGSSRSEYELEFYNQTTLFVQDFGRFDQNWQQAMLGDNWEELEELDSTIYQRGLMTLAEVGCGAVLYLIMNGPCRGNIFVSDFHSISPKFCTPDTFLDYYETWQDACLTGVPSQSCIFMPHVIYDFSR